MIGVSVRVALLGWSLTITGRLAAQQDHRHPPGQQRDSAFRALQERGKGVMGVDQYTSAHVFESLPDGGRIELQRDVDDSVGVRIIRSHMLEVSKRFTAGDFSLSEAVHAEHEIPGVATLRALRAVIRYEYRGLPRGGEVRITTNDARALQAIHEFLAFQRSDHRTREAAARGGVYHGRSRQLVAAVPRLDASVAIDGELTEDAWKRAAVLTGFSSYLPLDNRPAQDSTELLIWYTATDVYFGIRAYETHGSVHATRAARDRIDSDDYIQLLIDPFNDRRRAFVFGVNPLGAQADGIRTDAFGNTPSQRGQTFGGNPPANIDINPDFVFSSKGRLTDWGYEVEVRIPLKSIRFQGTNEQRWSFQALRYVQHSGYQQTWTPARRGSAAFLGQSGTLTGFHDLQRETVFELNPEVTTSISGREATGGWQYKTSPDAGANLRWRVVPNVTLNATVRPDFSQVEADAAQIPGDTRFALFFPEKRPFFVDGSDQFDSPNGLIYTRRILQPVAAAKMAGKFGRTNAAFLSAVDDRAGSALGEAHPVYNLLRVKRDILTQSTMGFTYTDRVEGDDYNRVASADARIVYGGVYALSLSGGGA